MFTILQIIGGLCAIVLGFYLISIGKSEGGEIKPFLRNDVIRSGYVMLILTLFFWGGAWLVATSWSLL